MYVGLKMITDVIFVTKKTSISEANELMEKNRLWMLPVVEKEKLIGYVTLADVRTALPSPATLLSKYELPEVVAHITVVGDALQRRFLAGWGEFLADQRDAVVFLRVACRHKHARTGLCRDRRACLSYRIGDSGHRGAGGRHGSDVGQPSGYTVELIAYPVQLAFPRDAIDGVYVPYMEGMRLLPSFFSEGHEFNSGYPGQLFGDFAYTAPCTRSSGYPCARSAGNSSSCHPGSWGTAWGRSARRCGRSATR